MLCVVASAAWTAGGMRTNFVLRDYQCENKNCIDFWNMNCFAICQLPTLSLAGCDCAWNFRFVQRAPPWSLAEVKGDMRLGGCSGLWCLCSTFVGLLNSWLYSLGLFELVERPLKRGLKLICLLDLSEPIWWLTYLVKKCQKGMTSPCWDMPRSLRAGKWTGEGAQEWLDGLTWPLWKRKNSSPGDWASVSLVRFSIFELLRLDRSVFEP